MPLQFFLKKI